MWWFVGTVGRIVPVSALVLFIIARSVAGLALLYVAGSLISAYLFREARWAWVTWFTLALSSGFGGFFFFTSLASLADPLYILPSADLWIPEMTTFRSIGHSALFACSQLLILTIVFLWVRSAGTDRRWRWGIYALFSLLTLNHPYDLFSVMGILSMYELLTHCRVKENPITALHRIRDLGILAIAGIAPMVLQLTLMAREVAFSGWIAQNLTWSPPPYTILIGYGALVPFAIIGGASAWRRRRAFDTLLVAWVLAGVVLVFAPLPYQRRLLSGLHIPITLLATMGARVVWERTASWRTLCLLGAMLMTTFLLFTNATVLLLSTPLVHSQRRITHTDRSVLTAFAWIRDETSPDALFLIPNFFDANIAPVYTLRRLWFAHGHQTTDSERKKQRLKQFLALENAGVADVFLRSEGITHVLVSQTIPIIELLRENGTLEPVFTDGTTTVFRVVTPAPR